MGSSAAFAVVAGTKTQQSAAARAMLLLVMVRKIQTFPVMMFFDEAR
jgi:hypothetical protein